MSVIALNVAITSLIDSSSFSTPTTLSAFTPPRPPSGPSTRSTKEEGDKSVVAEADRVEDEEGTAADTDEGEVGIEKGRVGTGEDAVGAETEVTDTLSEEGEVATEEGEEAIEVGDIVILPPPSLPRDHRLLLHHFLPLPPTHLQKMRRRGAGRNWAPGGVEVGVRWM